MQMSRNSPTLLSFTILASLAVWPAAWATAVETDLDVILIERTPKYDYDATQKWPNVGDPVTFHAHIRHWGDATSPTLPSVSYVWKIDGQQVGSGTITAFEPVRPPFSFDYAGYPNPYSDSALRNAANWPKNPSAFPNPPPTGLRVVTLPWIWQTGSHTVELVVDPNNAITEKTEANNSRLDYTNAIMASFWVEEGAWRYFHEYQHLLGVGSNSWEDWIQRQMAKQNELYAAAIWDISPQGVQQKVRIDRIIVVPDGQLPVNGGLPTNNPDSSDKTIDLQWGFTADQVAGSFYADHTSVSINNPFYIEQSLIHELGHARYLIDSYGFDVHNTAHNGGYDSVQIWEGDVYVAGSTYMPFLAFGEVLHYNTNGGVMTGPYGFQWSPYEAGALNLIAGQRAVCGNMNSPCNIGVYLQDLPQNNHMRFVDAYGWPRANVNVRIYRATSGPGWYGKTFDNTYDAEYDADANGYITMPRNPFTGGTSIQHTYGIANSVMILRIQQGSQIWYRFVEASSFNMEYWKGNTQDAYYTLELPGANGDSDGDGLPDSWELHYFSNLSLSGSHDPDSDGLNNTQEYQRRTHPANPDTDDDGLNDGPEVYTDLTDPLNPDTDGDGWSDGDEVHVHGTSPTRADTDYDTISDSQDNCPLIYNPGQHDDDGDGIGDACDPDFNSPPSVNVGDDQVITLPAGASLSAAVSDDGLPNPPGQLTLTWSQVDGPGTAVFTAPHDAATTVNFDLPGPYTLRLTAEDGQYQTSDDLMVLALQEGRRIDYGQIAYYTFDESGGDVVHDRSAVGTPLDLTIAHPAYTTWTGGGLAVNAATLITSGGPATKIFQALTASNALTLELWITPLSVSQTGPPRILTLSPDTNNRNASLVQGLSGTLPKDVIDAKLRTTATTNNASPSIVTAAGSLTPALTHVVYTRDAAGVARIYLDNVLRASGTIGGNLSNWDPAYPLALANEPSLNRPWLGTFHLAAIYQRALAPAEIAHHFAIGPEPVTTVAGDLNCDGRLDLDDIPAFVLALLDEDGFAAQYPACDRLRADLNRDEIVDGADVQGFTVLLIGR